MSERIRVPELRLGEAFEWCGRAVRLDRVEFDERRPSVTSRARASRWLHVREENGTEHRLGYHDHESVLLREFVRPVLPCNEGPQTNE